ncbi:TlpA family protein disulfide reductase [Pusillimonas sp.]|uniref:TlpA family protein disulfide reductase n=1 Tax=Pusillimonas sp. TaxID=3040095 RepID=UPI0037C6E0BD
MNRRAFLLRAGSLAGAGFALALPLPALAADSLFSEKLPDVDGVEQPLRQWLGKPVVVNFWATWCPPCVNEMPDLEELHQKYPDVHFLGLAVDTAVNVRKFNEKVQVSYPLLMIGHGGIERMRAMGNRAGGLPFTVVYDARGQASETILGQVKPAELEKIIQGL